MTNTYSSTMWGRAPSPVLPTQRRTSLRYRCQLRTLGRLGFSEKGEVLNALVHDLSETGIGFNLGKNLTVGTPVVIRLKGTGPEGTFHLPAWVVHCTAEDEENWRIGCRFERHLDPEAIADLL